MRCLSILNNIKEIHSADREPSDNPYSEAEFKKIAAVKSNSGKSAKGLATAILTALKIKTDKNTKAP